MNTLFETRLANKSDSADIARIYNQGIDDRIATFETSHRTPLNIEAWLDSGRTVVVCVSNGKVVAFAASFPYSDRECYRGLLEFSIYVDREFRGNGIGRATILKLMGECESRGAWKLVSRVFTENMASRNLLKSVGFREVGVYEKHGKLDGVWKDTVIVEYLIQSNIV